MEIYQNVNGNSGIAGYKIGDTCIEVEFADTEGVYRYSYESAGRENVEEMKRLAAQVRESCFKGLSFSYCSIMILKDTDRKEVYIVKTARREIEGRPVLAVCYDFDRTLSPENMQDGYIRAVDYDVDSFWEESNRLAEDHCMDQNLAYMYKMLQSARGKEILNKERLKQYGGKVRLYNGIRGWFRRINAYGERRGILVEHYIISSGLREIIEGTAIAKDFTHIYASSFYYNEHGEPCWPAQVINYTNKTQFLFRIEKGILDINDNAVNDHFAEGELRVPFRNIVYIGDSATDIPCMRLVNSLGGHSIGVYDLENTASKDTVRRMIRDERIRYYVPADYTKGSEMDILMHRIIDKTAAYEVLEEKHLRDRKEAMAKY